MEVEDSSALGAEFERHRARLTAIAGRILGDGHEAQDVVQEGFLRWHAVGGRADIRTPAAWLTTVVQNLAIDRLRQRERAVEAARELALLDSGMAGANAAEAAPTPEDILSRLFDLSAVLALLRERLSEAERTVLVLHEACEREHEEIARLLRISESNSRQLLHRARKRLAKDEQRAQEERRCRELVHEFHLALHRLDVPVLIGLLSDTPAVQACMGPRTIRAYDPGASRGPASAQAASDAAWARQALRRLLGRCLPMDVSLLSPAFLPLRVSEPALAGAG